MTKANDFFSRFSRRVAALVGHPFTFSIVLALVLLWLASGPLFHFSDTWQLIINTITTITTGLIVFIIQNSQNHDTKALHVKLDELITAVEGARNSIAGIEDKSDRDIEAIKGVHE